MAACLLAVAVSIAAKAQGPLAPSGPPGPTMKTLQQIEPRTAISSLPFVIATSGSYYVTTNLFGSDNQDGITVTASDVTLDLGGFVLDGTVSGSAVRSDGRAAPNMRCVGSYNGINAQAVMKFLLTLLLAASVTAGRSATTIDAVNHYAYGANIGWLDWRGDVANGAVIGEYVCSGYIYAANVGWINLGGGSPPGGIYYTNTTAGNWGGEPGWIRQPARLRLWRQYRLGQL